MVVIAHSPHAERLSHGVGSIVVQGRVLERLEDEERRDESVGLQKARYIETNLLRSGTEPVVKNSGKARGRPIAGPADRKGRGWGWAY